MFEVYHAFLSVLTNKNAKKLVAALKIWKNLIKKSHKAYASCFLDATFSHNIIDKKPLTLLKKEHKTLTLRKRPQGPGKKEEKLIDFLKDFVRF